MRTEAITQVVGTKYIAEDGTEFLSQEECEKYEHSALFVTRSKVRLIASTTEEEFAISGCYDDIVEIFDVQTQEDLDNLKAYLHLMLSTHNTRDFDRYFGESEFGFNNVTIGHEVIIWWNYDQDHFWVYGDGSVDAYVKYAKEKALKSIAKNSVKKETNE